MAPAFRLASAFVVALATARCGAEAPSSPMIREAITYRIVDDQELKLDLATPAGDGPFPAVVFVHGGGWIVGNRSRYRNEIEEAARRGFVGATVTYRLSKTGKDTPSVDGFPAALHDVKAAVRFLRTNADEYDVDPGRIGVVGESAGGHLALMTGLTRPKDGFEGKPAPDAPSSGVQAVVNVSGPTDLSTLAQKSPRLRPLLVMLLGAAPELVPERYREASPVAYVRKDGPPILTIHGSRDSLVPVAQALRLDAAMKKAGGRHELLVLRNAGHGFRGDHYRRSVEAIFDFLSQTLKRP